MSHRKLDFCHRMYMEIRQTSAAFQSYMDPLFAEVGLKPQEGSLLAELDHADGRAIGELACATGIKATNLPPLWRALEAKGLVERRRDKADGRSHRLYLTDEGRRVLGRLDDMVGAGLDRDADQIDALRIRAVEGLTACRDFLAGSAAPPGGRS